MFATPALVTLNVPLPCEKATGTVFQPGPPTSAMSSLLSPLKSPDTGLTLGACAHPGMFATPALVTLNVPLPCEKATGTVFQPGPPTSAMSSLRSPLKSPDTGLTLGACAQRATLSPYTSLSRTVPLPCEKATGTVFQPGPPTSAM